MTDGAGPARDCQHLPVRSVAYSRTVRTSMTEDVNRHLFWAPYCECTIDQRDRHVVDQEYGCPVHGVRRWCRTCGRVTIGYHSKHDSFAERVSGVYAMKHPTHPNDPYGSH